MSIKSKLAVGATLIALVGTYAVLQATKEQADKRKVTVTGLWLDSPRMDKVEVSVSVGSSTTNTVHINAPFGPKVYKVAPGTLVMIRLRLLGSSGAKFLGCIISVDGLVAMETPAHTGVGPGTESMCWAVA